MRNFPGTGGSRGIFGRCCSFPPRLASPPCATGRALQEGRLRTIPFLAHAIDLRCGSGLGNNFRLRRPLLLGLDWLRLLIAPRLVRLLVLLIVGLPVWLIGLDARISRLHRRDCPRRRVSAGETALTADTSLKCSGQVR